MGHPLNHARSNPDHLSPAGDRVTDTIIVKVYASGALSVEGAITDTPIAVAILENAIDAVKGQAAKQLAAAIVPPNEVSIG